jgi:hypothetical protein
MCEKYFGRREWTSKLASGAENGSWSGTEKIIKPLDLEADGEMGSL